MKEINYKDFVLNYDEFAKKCKESGEPVLLVGDDKKELIVMDVDAYEKRAALLHAQELVLESYAEKLSSGVLISNENVFKTIDELL